MFHLLIAILLGIFCGWAAAKLMGLDESNWVRNLLLGIAGSLVGGLLAWLLGLTSHNFIGSCLISIAGACLCVWLYKRYQK